MKSFQTPYDKRTSKQRREQSSIKYVHVSTPQIGKKTIQKTDGSGPIEVPDYDFRGKGVTLNKGANMRKRTIRRGVL